MGNKPGVYELMGKAYIKLKDYQKAENSFLTAIALGSNTKSNYFTLSKLVKCRATRKFSKSFFKTLTTFEILGYNNDFINFIDTNYDKYMLLIGKSFMNIMKDFIKKK